MLLPGSAAAESFEEAKQKTTKAKEALAKLQKLHFHQNREPFNFPRVKFDINDHEFVEILADVDHIYLQLVKMGHILARCKNATISKLLVFMNDRSEQGQLSPRRSSTEDIPKGDSSVWASIDSESNT